MKQVVAFVLLMIALLFISALQIRGDMTMLDFVIGGLAILLAVYWIKN